MASLIEKLPQLPRAAGCLGATCHGCWSSSPDLECRPAQHRLL